MKKHQLPDFVRGAAFIYKYQNCYNRKRKSSSTILSFPTLPDVNIDGVHAFDLESNQKTSRMHYRVARAKCNNVTFNESHIPVAQLMEYMHNHLKNEINEVQFELNTLSDIAQSFLPPAASHGRTPRQRRSMNDKASHNRTRRLIGAVAAVAPATGFILGEPIKNAACNALSFFNPCDSTDDLEREHNQVTKQQASQQKEIQKIKQSTIKITKNLFYFEMRYVPHKRLLNTSKQTLMPIFGTCLIESTLTKKRFEVINLRVHIVTFFKGPNFICHKLEHFTHFLQLFKPLFMHIETTFFPSFRRMPLGTSLHNFCCQSNSPQLFKSSLLKISAEAAN